MRAINLIGSVFGRLTVLERCGNMKGSAAWLCLCECGKKKVVNGYYLSKGVTRSCGCLALEHSKKFSQLNKSHSMSGTRIYMVWASMLRRCNNKNTKSYINYGGRGIKVCERWLEFSNFYEDMGLPGEGMTLERVDNDRGYSPDNCRWATRLEQASNKRTAKNSRVVIWGGVKRRVLDLAREYGVPYSTVMTRLSRGWGMERALGCLY